MKRSFCKYCILLLAAALLFTCFAVCAAAETPEIVASGNFSEVGNPNLSWTLDSEGTMILSGTGGTCSHDGYPYAVLSDQRIRKLIVEEGVTEIGDNTFRGAMNLESIVFPNSLTWIQWAAFESCVSLKTVEFGTGIEYIASNAFPISIDSVTYAYSLTQPIHFFYPGSEEDWSLVRDPMSGVYGGATELHNYGNAYFHYNVVDWGYCGGEGDGTNLTWTLDSEGTLTISGTGIMGTYHENPISFTSAPWGFTSAPWGGSVENVQRIKNLVIENGVENVGSYAFSYCPALVSVTLPDSLLTLERGSFYYCTGLESITIPNSVTKIVDFSFYYCTGLQDVTLSSGLTGIWGHVFYHCTSLESITIPDSITKIGGYAFGGCSSLKNVAIPNSVVDIGECSFCACPALKSITIPDSVTRIGGGAFQGSGLEHVTIPDSVTRIWDSAFSHCEHLVSVTVGSGVTRIDSAAFNTCTSLTDVSLPEGLTSIAGGTFNCCGSLKNIDIPNSVTSIGDRAFYQCGSLESIRIPDGVTYIGEQAFEYCASLANATLPGSVSTIGYNAFHGCSAFTDVYYKGGEEQWNAISVSEGNEELLNANIVFNVVDWGYCGGEGDGTNLTWILTDDGTLAISGTGAMRDYRTSLYEVAPWWARQISTVTLSEGITYIGENVFQGLYDVTELNIPASVTAVGDYAFFHMGLVDIYIPAGLTEMNAPGFSSCSNRASVTVDPENPVYHSAGNCMIKTAEQTLSLGCKNSVIPDDGSVTKIGPGAFSGCAAMTQITIPDCITQIGDSAFSGCSGLIQILIPENVTGIGKGAFSLCTGLTHITIPEGITMLDYNTFGSCYALVSAALPASLETIAIDAFHNDSNLSYVFYAGNEAQWEEIDIVWIMPISSHYLNNAYIHYNATDHTPGEAVTENNVPATCTEAGGYDEVVYCTVCPAELSRTHVTADPTNHPDAQNVAATEATETAHGYTAGVYCPDCDTWLSGHEVIHNHLGAQTVIQPPTETEDGLVDIVCTVCGQAIRYTATWEEPEPEEEPGGIQGFWMRITTFFRGFIDWFLRLFRKP